MCVAATVLQSRLRYQKPSKKYTFTHNTGHRSSIKRTMTGVTRSKNRNIPQLCIREFSKRALKRDAFANAFARAFAPTRAKRIPTSWWALAFCIAAAPSVFAGLTFYTLSPPQEVIAKPIPPLNSARPQRRIIAEAQALVRPPTLPTLQQLKNRALSRIRRLRSADIDARWHRELTSATLALTRAESLKRLRSIERTVATLERRALGYQ